MKLKNLQSGPAERQPVANPARSGLKIPPILFEGDDPPPPAPEAAAQKYAVGPGPAGPKPYSQDGELPEAYGTQKLMLVARDPHWLYAHWDLTREQQGRYNALSAQRHLVVRIYEEGRSDHGAQKMASTPLPEDGALGPAGPTLAEDGSLGPAGPTLAEDGSLGTAGPTLADDGAAGTAGPTLAAEVQVHPESNYW